MQLTDLLKLQTSSSEVNLSDDLIKNQFDGLDNRSVKQHQLLLFYGSNLFDKATLAASLGEKLKMEVHTIQLSKVVGKYIGETEKNLQELFARAEEKEWILFFDEAGALFGKRTDVKDSHDRYANIEVSYLMQLFEKFKGTLILSSSADNIDDKWIKHFRSTIHLPKKK